MSTTPKERSQIIHRLGSLGFSYEQANQLRRISITLQRWFELECGTSGHNDSTHSIERDEVTEKPFYRVQYQSAAAGWIDNRRPVADREKGARQRLAKLMSAFPLLTAYIQTDCRGPALYILKCSDVNGHDIEQVYTRGLAVY